MHVRILFSLLGQLVAVPTALFLLPSPDLDLNGGKSAASNQVESVDDVGLQVTKDDALRDR